MPRLFADKLRLLRGERKITQVELTRKLGLSSQGYLADLESGKEEPSLDLILRTAHLFGVSPDLLLRDTTPVESVRLMRDTAFTPQDLSLEHFASTLRTLRLERQITQFELARQLGLARRGYISNLEAARKKPSAELLVQIADFFGVATDDLLRPRLQSGMDIQGNIDRGIDL